MLAKAGTKLSPEFQIAETETFQKAISRPEFKKLRRKLADYVYPQLSKNPLYGLNIKRLKGELADFYRYRMGTHRLFYQVDKDKILVFIIALKHRKDAYR